MFEVVTVNALYKLLIYLLIIVDLAYSSVCLSVHSSCMDSKLENEKSPKNY